MAPGDQRTSRGCDRAGDLEHPLVDIEANDLARGTDGLGGVPGNHAGATRHIEHGLSGLQSSEGHQVLGFHRP